MAISRPKQAKQSALLAIILFYPKVDVFEKNSIKQASSSIIEIKQHLLHYYLDGWPQGKTTIFVDVKYWTVSVFSK